MAQGVIHEPADSPLAQLRERAVGFGVLLTRALGEIFGSSPGAPQPRSVGTAASGRPLAEIARSVDETLAQLFDCPTLVTRVWEDVCGDVASGTLDAGRGAELLREVFGQVANLLTSTQDALVRKIEADGFPLSRAEQFRRAVAETLRLTERYLIRWALLDADVIRQARQEYEQGDYPSPGVALADLLAARHAEQALPSYGDLKTWADHASPLPSWFEEETD